MLGAGGTGSFGRFFRLLRPSAFWELLPPLLPATLSRSRSCPLSMSSSVGERDRVLGFFFFLGLFDSELLVPVMKKQTNEKEKRLRIKQHF